MERQKNGALRWVIVPAGLTLLITLVRLWGELDGGDPSLFGTAPGGTAAPRTEVVPNPPPSLVGIYWLMPIFGAWFAFRLLRRDEGPEHRGAALGWPLLGLAVAAGGFGAILMLGREPTPMFIPASLGFFVVCSVAAVIAGRGWRPLFWLLLAYGFAARVPIVVLTFVLCALDKGTHYEKLAPMAPTDLAPMVRATMLSLAQLGLWIPATVILGSIAGALTAMVVPKRPA